MDSILNSMKSGPIRDCALDTVLELENSDSTPARLTFAALLRFDQTDGDKPAPSLDTKIKDSVVKTGAYYFGPMFVMDKGTSIPNIEITKELGRRGFYTESLKHLNNAQLNLFFIMLKSLGLVSDKHLIGYFKYSAGGQ